MRSYCPEDIFYIDFFGVKVLKRTDVHDSIMYTNTRTYSEDIHFAEDVLITFDELSTNF